MLQWILKIKKLFFTLFLINIVSIAKAEHSHPFNDLKKDESALFVGTSYSSTENEYEIGKVVIETQEYTHYQSNLLFEKRFDNAQFGLGLDYTISGKLNRIIKDNPALTTYDIKYSGLHALSFYYRHHFELDDDNKKIAIEVSTKGSPLKKKDVNNTYEGPDLSLAFHYSYDHKSIRFYGKLDSSIYGKTTNLRVDGEKETVYPYSQFGNLIGVQLLMDKQWFDLSGEFHLTTDYRSSSTSYSRLTDKGFVIALNATYARELNDNTVLFLSHKRSGKNFNVIAEDMSQEKEFEIEAHTTQLGIKCFF